MSAAAAHFYCDQPTRTLLLDGGQKVLLLGSYGGFSNFGDVLQLKGAIQWHRDTTGLEPVLICHTTAIPDAKFCARQRAWFGVRGILYWSPERQDMSAAGLAELSDTLSIPRLHVYGGGFLNRYWGAGTVASIEGVIRRFGVGQYVISGQQIDEQFVPELREHFHRFRPALVGGRDPLSVRLLETCGVAAADSFDDAAEALRDFAAGCRVDPHGAADFLLHLNLSYYTGSERLDEVADALARCAAAARKHSADRPPRVVLLQAYADQRTDEIVDALGAVCALEDRFPFPAFETVQLGLHSLWHGQPGAPPVTIPRAPLALSSSYHVALLLSLLDVPCHIAAGNAYYTQKRQGLGGGDDLANFLAEPRKLDLAPRFALRGPWLQRLGAALAEPPAAVEPLVPPAENGDPRPWRPKSRMIEVVRSELAQTQAHNETLAREANAAVKRLQECSVELDAMRTELQTLAQGFEERGQLNQQLQNEYETLRGELDRLREAFDQRGTRLAEVEAECQKVWNDSRELANGFEERGRVVQETEATCRRLWEDNQRLDRLLGEQTAEVAQLRERLARRWWHRLTRPERPGASRSG